MELFKDDVHIWSASLALAPEQENSYVLLLSHDEQVRAARFRFADHRRRFIAARSILRQILSFYTNINPSKIEFSYGEHGKPALLLHAELQFNLTHSEELAVYAIAHQRVGIDIELIKSRFEPALPARFFSALECEKLAQIPVSEQAVGFYQLWARKEAIIKASGKGLTTSLASFSVCPDNIEEKILLGEEEWYLQPLTLQLGYATALATERPVKKLSYYNFTDGFVKL